MLIGVALAVLFGWTLMISLATKSRNQAVKDKINEELVNAGVDSISSSDIEAATKSVFENTDLVTTGGADVRDLIEMRAMSAVDTNLMTDEELLNRAKTTSEARVISENKKKFGSIWKGYKYLIGVVVFEIICIGVILYLWLSTDVGYYGYFIGAVGALVLLLLFNFWNKLFFIPLIICLVLAGFFIGRGAQEVIVASTLESGIRAR